MNSIQDIYQNALKFAGERHFNQTVKGSKANYLLHISNVTMEVLFAHKESPDFDLEFAMLTAILHDVIEDTKTSYDEVKEQFGERVADAVLALSKDESLPYHQQMPDSLKRINQLDREVGIVKLADRITNLQKPPEDWSVEKRRKYLNISIEIAEGLQHKHDYLHARLQEKIKDYKEYL